MTALKAWPLIDLAAEGPVRDIARAHELVIDVTPKLALAAAFTGRSAATGRQLGRHRMQFSQNIHCCCPSGCIERYIVDLARMEGCAHWVGGG